MAKDQDYEAAVEKGTKLLQMLTKKTKTSIESAFKHTKELAQHGYYLETNQTSFEIECTAKALRDLNVRRYLRAPQRGGAWMVHADDVDDVLHLLAWRGYLIRAER